MHLPPSSRRRPGPRPCKQTTLPKRGAWRGKRQCVRDHNPSHGTYRALPPILRRRLDGQGGCMFGIILLLAAGAASPEKFDPVMCAARGTENWPECRALNSTDNVEAPIVDNVEMPMEEGPRASDIFARHSPKSRHSLEPIATKADLLLQADATADHLEAMLFRTPPESWTHKSDQQADALIDLRLILLQECIVRHERAAIKKRGLVEDVAGKVVESCNAQEGDVAVAYDFNFHVISDDFDRARTVAHLRTQLHSAAISGVIGFLSRHRRR